MSSHPSARAAVAVFLGLGSNVGDREGHLRAAVRAIVAWGSARGLSVSRLYETAYVGPGEQEPYLNACVRIITSLSPQELRARTRALERNAGRVPTGHMQPRTLDVDLLLYGAARVRAQGLEIPHPRLRERRFVLEPLLELDDDLRHPEDDLPLRADLGREEVQAQGLRPVAAGDWWLDEPCATESRALAEGGTA